MTTVFQITVDDVRNTLALSLTVPERGPAGPAGPAGPSGESSSPPTIDASLLTAGTLADARLSSEVVASLGKADSASQPGHTHSANECDALPLAGGALDVDAEVTASITPDGNGRSVDTEFGGWGFGVEEKIGGNNTGKTAHFDPDGFYASGLNSANTHLSSIALTFDNGSSVKKGKADAGIGGNGGVALKCSLEYEMKWDGGRLFVTQQDGTTIRSVEHCLTVVPTANDDSTKGFVVGSRWILDDGTAYVCTDDTAGEAEWAISDLEITDSSKGIVFKSPNNSRFRLTVDNDGVLTTAPVA